MGYDTYIRGEFTISPTIDKIDIPGVFSWVIQDDKITPSSYTRRIEYLEDLMYIISQVGKLGDNYTINGEAEWKGDYNSDCGLIIVKDNVMSVFKARESYSLSEINNPKFVIYLLSDIRTELIFTISSHHGEYLIVLGEKNSDMYKCHIYKHQDSNVITSNDGYIYITRDSGFYFNIKIYETLDTLDKEGEVYNRQLLYKVGQDY